MRGSCYKRETLGFAIKCLAFARKRQTNDFAGRKTLFFFKKENVWFLLHEREHMTFVT
jgi:hypothetical protein